MTSTNHRITDSTPLLGGELMQSVPIGTNRVVHVSHGIAETGPFAGRTCVILRGMHRAEAGWTYSGREIVIPVEQASDLAAAVTMAAGQEGGSDATNRSPASGG